MSGCFEFPSKQMRRIYLVSNIVHTQKNSKMKINRSNDISVSQSLGFGSNGNTTIEPAPSNRNRARIWFFTLNNYTAEDIVSLSHNIWGDNTKIKLYVFQKEIGQNGTKHLQGVVQFMNQTSFSTLKAINSRAHWQKTKGLINSIKYCSKEDTRDGGQEAIFTYGIIGTNYEKYLWKKKKEKLSDETILRHFRDMWSEERCREVVEQLIKNGFDLPL